MLMISARASQRGKSTRRVRGALQVTPLALALALAGVPLAHAGTAGNSPVVAAVSPQSAKSMQSATQLGTVQVDAVPLQSATAFEKVEIKGLSEGPQVTVDSASLVRRVPGASLNFYGPMAGQVQYRGLYGAHQNVRIDGMHINPGGPNGMDTPLHYLPRAELDTLTVQRGIAPVADGIETMGTTVRATSQQARFTDSSAFRAQGAGMLGYSSVDNGYLAGGMLGSANESQRFDVVAARDHAGDARFSDGTIRDSAYSRKQAGADYGVR